MSGTELKPDLGLYFLENYGEGVKHNFYEVQFADIIHAGDNLYSFTSYPTIEGIEYAVSFDFNSSSLEELIGQINDAEFKSYLESVLIKKFTGPEKAAFYDSPISVDIEAILGEPVKSKYETFVPFVVKKFSNLYR